MKYLLSLLGCVLAIAACSNDDDSQQIDNRFFGQFQLIGIEDSTSTLRTTPKDQSPINFTFYENGSYEGETSKNTFNGQYHTNSNDILTFKYLGTTEVLETDWGQLFFNSLNKSYDSDSKNYLLQYRFLNDTLFLEYNNSKKLLMKKL